MQSIDDEIPDLSGPVSLGTYKFTRRGRGNKYETLRLSELPNAQEKEGEIKVKNPAPTSLAHPPFNPSAPTTSSSFTLSNSSTHQTEVERNDNISNSPNKSSHDKRGFHEPVQLQYNESDLTHSAAVFSTFIRSTYSDKKSAEVPGRDTTCLTAQDRPSNQNSSVSISADTKGSVAATHLGSSTPLEYQSSNHNLITTIHPVKHSAQQQLSQLISSPRLQDHSSNQNSIPWPHTDGQSPQTSKQAHFSFAPPDRQRVISQQHAQSTKTLNALTRSEEQSSRAPLLSNFLFPSQNNQQITTELHPAIESKTQDLLTARKPSPIVHLPAHRPQTPKGYALPQLSPLPDTLPTASFNLNTNEWDPDVPEANMSAQTPTNKSSRGGHSGQPSARKSTSATHPSQDVRNPYAIVTTTKSGRPYTNPYMPLQPPPSTAPPISKGSSSTNTKLNTQRDAAELAEHQRKTGYINQEEARYRALDQARVGRAEESLDDPFQDQSTPIQQYGRNQPSNYADYAAHQAAYGQLPGHAYHPPPTTYTPDPNTSPAFPLNQQAARAPNVEFSPYHEQRSAYEQQIVNNRRAQNPGVALHEQRQQYIPANPRVPVKLPAVRGTMDQPRLLQQEPTFENLSLRDSKSGNVQDQSRRHAQTVAQQTVSGKVSHAIPIRDPAAYTGSGLNMRRNQDVLRQNLDTVVASSQGPTGSARTVMNDPHRERKPSSEPSSAVTDSTITGSTLRAQAPSYESVATQWPVSTNPALTKPGQISNPRQGNAALVDSEPLPPRTYGATQVNNPERAFTDSGNQYRDNSFRAPAMPPNLAHDARALTRNAGLPASAVGAGNKFMKELVDNMPRKPTSDQRLEEATTWFRSDPRDLAYAAAILPYETMNRMNPEQFPINDSTPRTVSQLADDSQADNPSDQARQTATPRPIGHGRPATFNTPPSIQSSNRGDMQAPFSTLSTVSSVNDKDAMALSGQEFLRQDAAAIEAMFGGVYSNLMAAKSGDHRDYLSHYCPPPAYAIDHNTKKNDTMFDPQWVATAPPARVGRDPRREQGEYEDPTLLGSGSRRGEHARGDGIRRESGSGSIIRPWGRS